MSHGYGSLKGIIGVWLVAISVSLLMVLAPVASVSADSPAAGNDVTISASINPVRIVVVDDHDRITEILSNGPGSIAPSIHRGSSEGPKIAMSPSVSEQYVSIMRQVDQTKTGSIYKLQDDIAHRPSRLFNPTVISILLVGAHLVL